MLDGELGRVGEQAAEVAVVEVRDSPRRNACAWCGSAGAASSAASAADRLRSGLSMRGALSRERPHQRVHVFELLPRLPARVALPPLAVRRQPHGKRLGEILVRMALRVPRVEMQDEALAVRLRRVELRVGLRWRAEHLPPLPPQPQRNALSMA